MKNSPAQIIFTCQAEAATPCLAELRSAIGARPVRWLTPGVGIASLGDTFTAVARLPQVKQLVFLRHMFPLEYVLELSDGAGKVIALADEFAHRLDTSETFSVQVRSLDDPNGIEEQLQAARFFADRLSRSGFTLKPDRPKQVVSVVIHNGTLYIGLSLAEHNLSSWPGGMRRFRRYDGQISRAEFKLLEAIEVFGLELPPEGRALDLGAAPGGWSKVLADKGMSVVCVDPAELDGTLRTNPRVSHYRGYARDYVLQAGRERFDVVVNDMRMDAAESAAIMLELRDMLNADGIALMTFKLPKAKQAAAVKKGLDILSRRYEVLHARQLFHNRSEITVVMRKGLNE